MADHIDKLQKKCGSKQERKYFVRHLRETAEADRLPQYQVQLEYDYAVFLKRREAENAEGKVSGGSLP